MVDPSKCHSNRGFHQSGKLRWSITRFAWSHDRQINSQIPVTFGASAGVGFAVPVNIAKRIVPELVRSGEIRRPSWAFTTRDVEALKNQGELPVSDGVLIYQVAAGRRGCKRRLARTYATENGDVEIGHHCRH